MSRKKLRISVLYTKEWEDKDEFMKRVFITGISGFAGSHLSEYLVKSDEYEVSGTYLTDESLVNISNIRNKLNLIKIDLNDAEKIKAVVRKIKPDLIFHLAALPSPADSFKNPIKTLTNNINIQVNILETIKNANLGNTKILVVSSADIYGMVSKKDLPISEETPFKPANPYAVSKITQDFLGLQYFLSYNLNIIRVRPFNHIGPRQSPNFVVSSFAKKIAEIEKGGIELVIKVGNLNAKRDFTDVRDMVYAYTLAIEKGISGNVYNIGSGISYKIQEILDKLLSLSKVKIKVEADQALFRPIDEPELVCDNSKFVKLTGWKQNIFLDETLKDTLDYWRKIV